MLSTLFWFFFFFWFFLIPFLQATEIDVVDIRKVYDLFVDVKRSTEFLQAYQADFVFSEVTEVVEQGEMKD